jgi:hypothetical protein
MDTKLFQLAMTTLDAKVFMDAAYENWTASEGLSNEVKRERYYAHTDALATWHQSWLALKGGLKEAGLDSGAASQRLLELARQYRELLLDGTANQ